MDVMTYMLFGVWIRVISRGEGGGGLFLDEINEVELKWVWK
jgi:hypothetical protein